MPSTTACAGLPYPLASDPPDIQSYFQQLAEAVDTAICNKSGVPVGALIPWYEGAGTAPTPAGTLICDGTTFSSGTYPLLQQHLGSTTLPDLRGKFLRGKDAPGGAFPSRNQTGGWGDAQSVSHTHAINQHNHYAAHGHSATSASDTHWHTPLNNTTADENFVYRLDSTTASGGSQLSLQTGTGFRVEYGAGSTENDTHNHAITVNSFTFVTGYDGDSSSTRADVGPSGGTALNRNIPPFRNVVYLIQAV